MICMLEEAKVKTKENKTIFNVEERVNVNERK